MSNRGMDVEMYIFITDSWGGDVSCTFPEYMVREGIVLLFFLFLLLLKFLIDISTCWPLSIPNDYLECSIFSFTFLHPRYSRRRIPTGASPSS